jgi:hypothetical protein
MIPTPEEIVARIELRTPKDMFGFEVNEYLPYLPFEKAKPYLQPEVTKEEWGSTYTPPIREALLKVMEGYMGFAWEKANNCRGISANRSIMHYIAWTWLAGDADFSQEVEHQLEHNYEYYGKNILVMICQHYGWDPERWDDHRRVNSETE